MNFGQLGNRTSLDDNGSYVSTLETIRDGKVVKSVKFFNIRVKVKDSKQEMVEFMQFSDKLKQLKDAGKLYTDKYDTSTEPAFKVIYPKYDDDGTYFVVKRWFEAS